VEYNALIMLTFEILIAVADNFILLWVVKHHVVHWKPIYMASHPRCWQSTQTRCCYFLL